MEIKYILIGILGVIIVPFTIPFASLYALLLLLERFGKTIMKPLEIGWKAE